MSENSMVFEYDENGDIQICTTTGQFSSMMMDISVHRLAAGTTRTFCFASYEASFLLLSGEITFEWNGQTETAARADVFSDGPSCLSACYNTEVKITAAVDSEILIQKAENKKTFFTVLHKPSSVNETRFGAIGTDGKPSGIFRTISDYHTAPHSNLVIGEVIVPLGGWADYPPHHHPQPEAHFYRFDKPQGFGLGLVGDEAVKFTNNSFCAIPSDETHPQVGAPWYNMYYTWMIRNYPGAPWRECIISDEHKWIMGE